MSKKILTTQQYAEEKNKNRSTVLKAAKQNKLHLLPDVTKIIKISRYYLLEMSTS